MSRGSYWLTPQSGLVPEVVCFKTAKPIHLVNVFIVAFDNRGQRLLASSTFSHRGGISIGNRTISSTIWKLIDTSNVLKVLVIARADRRVQFKNFQNITSVY